MSSNGWNKHKLGEIANVQTGPFGSQLHQKDYVLFGTPIITVEHLGENHLLHENLPRVSDADKHRLNKYALKEGDIVFSRVGSVDRRALVKKDEEGWLFSGRCLRVRPTSKELNAEYLSYYFGLDAFKKYIRAIAVGSTMPSLNTTILSEIEIPLPPFETQRRIADILSALDEKIELNRQTNATLESIAQAIFREWFVEFNFPDPDETDPKGLSRDHAPLQAKESGKNGSRQAEQTFRVSGIPQGWRVGKLGDFGDIVCGKTPSKANSDFFGGEIPFIKIPDMHNSVFITKTEDSLTIEGAMSQKKKFLPPYSIVVSCIATVGLVAITSERSQTNQQINAIVPKDQFSSFYLYFCAKELDKMLKDLGSGGSATLNVNTSSFSNIDCVIPSENVLKNFDTVVSPIFEQIKNNEQQTATLAAVRDALLPKLMSGEIEV
jgi:type I restriction enzyme S subunit